MQTRGDRDRSRGERTPPDHPEVEARETIERTGEPERYAGYRLLDPRGQKIGRVERVFTSDGGEPQYVQVTTGWMRSKTLLIPTHQFAADENRRSLTLK